MKKLLFSVLTLLALGLTIQSCKKELKFSDKDTMTAEDYTAQIDLSEQVELDVDESIDGFVSGEVDERGDCPTVTFAQPKGTWPNTITLDYSDAGCTKGGRSYQGKIIVEQSDAIQVPGAVRTITFDNFYFEGVKIEGTKTVINGGINTAGLWKHNISVSQTLTYPDGSQATHNATRTRTLIEGGNTPSRLDNVWEITGEGSGTNRNGDVYSVTYVNPLIKKYNCPWIGQGTIEFTVNNLTRTLDFGTGDCDRDATLTLADGTVKDVKIRHHWWK